MQMSSPETTKEAPTVQQIGDSVCDRYVRLVGRRIGSRYLIVHANWNAFMFGVGVEHSRYGLLWFIGPFSFCLATPAEVVSRGD
jgi:hypothetical protein